MITVFGSINVDLVSRVASMPRPGETVLGSDYELIAGGKGANQALAAARVGARVRLAGAVGTDSFASLALAALNAGEVYLDAVVHRDGATGLAIVFVDAHGENSIVLAPGANATVKSEQISHAAFSADDTLLLQLEVPYSESRRLAERASGSGARVVLSVAPYEPLSRQDIAPMSILVMNQHEARDFAGHFGIEVEDEEAVVLGLYELLGKTVIATLGGDGAVAASVDGFFRVAALNVTPVDTTGAGDAFAGVLAAYLDEGADLKTAMIYAAAAGSLATTKVGAQPGLPSRVEIEKALTLGS